MSVFHRLMQIRKMKRAGYLVLIDPDKTPVDQLSWLCSKARNYGVDGFLVGGSLLLTPHFDHYVHKLKKFAGETPVIIFPGGVHQISSHADAILFLSLLSGRNPEQIIGNQVLAAPIIHKLGLEAISTAYLLIDSGIPTSAEFMSGTRPLPRNKPEIALAHALAAQFFGFKLIYLEGGSGAQMSVPNEIIQLLHEHISIPLIVGGGICTPEEAAQKVSAGADFIVTGNILENHQDADLMRAFADAIHA